MNEHLDASNTIFVITGTPGSGKSTISVALTERFPLGLHIAIDDLTAMVTSGYAPPVPEWTDETGRQFRLARRTAADMAGRYADDGFTVAIDDIILPHEAEPLYLIPLAPRPLTCVLLHTDVDVALERSARRNTKQFHHEILVSTIRDLHQTMEPDLYRRAGWIVVDSSQMTVDETAESILSRRT